jgi:hypothetical protein
MSDYLSLTYKSIKFIFKFDALDPTILHIFARHLIEPDDAIELFYDENATTEWNANRCRFETYSKSRGLFWFWIEENKVVMVISCFNL